MALGDVPGGSTVTSYLPGNSTNAVGNMDHARSVFYRRMSWTKMQQEVSHLSPFVSQLSTSNDYEVLTRKNQVTWSEKTSDITPTPHRPFTYDRRAAYTKIWHTATAISVESLAKGDRDYFGDWNSEAMYSEARLVDTVIMDAMVSSTYFENPGVRAWNAGTGDNAQIRSSMAWTEYRPDISFVLKTPGALAGGTKTLFDVNSLITLRYLIRSRQGGGPGSQWCVSLTPELESILFSDSKFQNRFNIFSNQMNGAGPDIGVPIKYLGFTFVPVEWHTMPAISTANISAVDTSNSTERQLLVRNASDVSSNSSTTALRGRLVQPESNAFPATDAKLRASARGLINSLDGATPGTAANGDGTYIAIKIPNSESMIYVWQPKGVAFLTRYAAFVKSGIHSRYDLSMAKASYMAVCFGSVRWDEDSVIAIAIKGKLTA